MDEPATSLAYPAITPSSGLQAGRGVGRTLTIGGVTPVWAVTVSFWQATSAATNEGTVINLADRANDASLFAFVAADPLTAASTMEVSASHLTGPVTAGATPVDTPFTWGDGSSHHYVMVYSQTTATTLTITLYVDGIVAATGTFNPAVSFGAGAAFALDMVEIAGNYTSAQASGLAGTYAHVAIWNRALSAADIAGLWQAGQGMPGELSGVRAARYLAGNYGGPVAIDQGLTTMGAATLAEGTTLLDALQEIAATELADLWVTGAGVLTLASRARRYAALTPTATLGELESPYEPDFATDHDATLVFNDIEITMASGIKVVVWDQASQDEYGPRSYQRTVNVLIADDAQNTATWILGTHKDPLTRIATLTLKPSANPALWPVALGAEIGQLVRVIRRTAAFTAVLDCFVEQISHSRKPNDWTVSLQLSPAQMWRVWTIEDPDRGRLDTGGCVIAQAATATGPTLVVTTAGGPLWTTDPADLPMDLVVAHERVTVSAVATGSGSTQTLTVTRAVNGVVRAAVVGDPVAIWNPTIIAL